MAQQLERSLAIIRLKQVKQRTGVSRSFIYSALKRGEFPPKVVLGPRAIGFLESDIEAWIEARVIASRQEQK